MVINFSQALLGTLYDPACNKMEFFHYLIYEWKIFDEKNFWKRSSGSNSTGLKI